jgi:hypothetical protein
MRRCREGLALGRVPVRGCPIPSITTADSRRDAAAELADAAF